MPGDGLASFKQGPGCACGNLAAGYQVLRGEFRDESVLPAGNLPLD